MVGGTKAFSGTMAAFNLSMSIYGVGAGIKEAKEGNGFGQLVSSGAAAILGGGALIGMSEGGFLARANPAVAIGTIGIGAGLVAYKSSWNQRLIQQDISYVNVESRFLAKNTQTLLADRRKLNCLIKGEK